MSVSKPRKKLKGRPTFDDRGNAIWKFAGEGEREVRTERVKALSDGLSLADPRPKRNPDPYNQPIPEDKEDIKRRSLDDMRRLSEEMKREHEEHARKLRSGTPTPLAGTARPLRGVRLRLRFDSRALLVDMHRPSILIGRGEDNDVVVNSKLASRLHASIDLSDNLFILTDISANGCFIQNADGVVTRIRRGKAHLDRHGMIGFGRRPKRGSPHTIQFSCEAF